MPSIEQLERLLVADPTDPLLLYGLAQEYAKQGKTDLAVQYYDRCIAADPHYCYAYYHKARAQAAANRGQDALATVLAGIHAARESQDAHALGELHALREDIA